MVYVLIAVCVVIAEWALSMRFPGWKPTALEKNLFSVLLATAVLLGYVLQWGWRYRKIPKFWLAFAASASVHCAVFVSLSFCVDHWSAFVIGPTVGAEVPAMAAFSLWAIDKKRV